ncbi:hypothetical protein LZZ85_05810 [Terrimonas sp. NA20]|uniref:DUF4251 domain-containing protein n=1 Tax=Terrimonas ginsenosidimutans TaxID=2908004 RepID=A0ABS9KNB2_9BACT|nr:hypothetical protein [Terrimonas ginsenosidimutans]MCG2613784.1 hypothetical protein [Terrimonas ginsenosidimutans]
MKNNAILSIVFLFCLETSCSNDSGEANPETAEVENSGSANYLTMKINGAPWVADQEIFGAFHPEGYDDAIMISGSKGASDKSQQAFNINLFKTAGPGSFSIQKGNPDNNVVQLGNLSPENYLYGSMMGFSMKVNVMKASANPVEIEAVFEGQLVGNAGDTLKITEGKFYYRD